MHTSLNKAYCRAWLLAVVSVAIPASLLAQNKYEVLARTLQPYGALFYSKSTTKAFQASVMLRDSPMTSSSFVNQPIRISLQVPNRLRIETLDPDHPMIFCRDDQRVWVYPRKLAEKIAAAVGVSTGPLPRIPDFRLPIRDNQIAFLPVLFQVLRFEPASDPDGRSAWNLDFRPAPELMGQASKEWSASTLVDQDNYKIRWLRIQGTVWNGTLDILASRFTHQLPPETWEPDPAFADGATDISPELFSSALEKLSAITLFR